MKLSKFHTERVWKLWVHPRANSCRGEYVEFVTKAKYDRLLREVALMKNKVKA